MGSKEFHYQHDISFDLISIINRTFHYTYNDLELQIITDKPLQNSEFVKHIERIRDFNINVLNGSLCFSLKNKWASKFIFEKYINKTENNIILLPDEPTEEILATIIKRKIESLTDYDFFIDKASISVAYKDNVRSFGFSDSDLLPSKETWINGDIIKDKPWWERNDFETYDSRLIDNKKSKPVDNSSENSNTGAVIIRHEFLKRKNRA